MSWETLASGGDFDVVLYRRRGRFRSLSWIRDWDRRCNLGLGLDIAIVGGAWEILCERKQIFYLSPGINSISFHYFFPLLTFQKWTPQLQRNKSSKMIHTQTEKKEKKYPNIHQTRRKNAHNTFPQDREQIRASCHYGHVTRAVRSCSVEDAFGFLFREEREMCMDCVVR